MTMISEEQLKNFEGMAKELLYDGSLLKPVIYHLIAEVRGLQKTLHAVSDTSNKLLEHNNQLEKEADWLAKYATGKSPCIKPLFDCREAGQINQCHICLRDVARKTVQNV